MQHLAKLDWPSSVPATAKAAGLQAADLRPLFLRLARAGLVRGLPGRGYMLARPAGQISVWDVVRAIEPLHEPHAPCGGDWEACPPRAACTLAPVCRQAQEGYREALRSLTLGQLRESPVALPLCSSPPTPAP